jgi:aminoglycoside phosphotransferase (APT) family kinase protein
MNAVENLAKRDEGIAGLGTILAPERLAESIHARLGRATIDDIRLDYIRYKPGINCIARYVVKAGGQTVNAYAKAHGPDAPCKMEKAGIRQTSETVLGPGRILLENESVVFSMFPNDSKLKAIQALAVEGAKERLLRRVFGRDSLWQEGDFDQPLNYKPERRYVVRIKHPSGDLAILKFHTPQDYQRILSNKHTSNVIGHSGRRAVFAHRWLAGDTLKDRCNSGRLRAEHIGAAASALAEFHNGTTESHAATDRSIQLSAIHTLGAQIGFLLPRLRTRASRTAKALGSWLAAEEPIFSPVHGDFYDEQVVIRGKEAILIDLDEVRLDDPLVDLGNYAAHMERDVISGRLSSVQCQQHLRTLVSAYESERGGVSERRLRLYVALSLFRLVQQPFRDFEQCWPERIQENLERVENLIEGEGNL